MYQGHISQHSSIRTGERDTISNKLQATRLGAIVGHLKSCCSVGPWDMLKLEILPYLEHQRVEFGDSAVQDRIARRKLEEEKEKEHIAVEEEPLIFRFRSFLINDFIRQ